MSRRLDRARGDIRRHIRSILEEQHGLAPEAVAECLQAAAESPELEGTAGAPLLARRRER